MELQEAIEEFKDAAPLKLRETITSHQVPSFKTQVTKTGRWVTVSNVQRYLVANSAAIPINEEVQECFHIVQGKQRDSHGLSSSREGR